MTPQTPRSFVCYLCCAQCVDNTGTTQQDKVAEMELVCGGEVPQSDRVSVCDECFEKLRATLILRGFQA